MENETWISFANGYEVSNTGNVRSIDRVIKTAKYPMNLKGKMLKPAIDKKGYKRVAIMVDGKLITLKVHRIVAKAFIDNVNDKPQVNHIDGIKTNNHVSNLEWMNNSENIQHAFDNGLMKAKRLHESHRSKQTKEGIERMCFLRSLGMSYQSIAKEVGVSKSVAMKNIKNYAIYTN
jgi:hypothetical protein